MKMKTLSLVALAMFVSAPAFADQDIADIYSSQGGAIAFNSMQTTFAPKGHKVVQQAQPVAQSEQSANARASTTTDTGPYVDDNPYN